MDKNRLSLKLLELRQENNLTQKQLCEELNISRANYSYFENGHRIPDIYTLLLISKYYHISLDELVSAENFKSSRKKDQIAQCDSDISITHHLKSKHIPIECVLELTKTDFDILSNFKKLSVENQNELVYLMNYKLKKQLK